MSGFFVHGSIKDACCSSTPKAAPLMQWTTMTDGGFIAAVSTTEALERLSRLSTASKRGDEQHDDHRD